MRIHVKFQKLMASLLCFTMLFGLFAITASADQGDSTGASGEDVVTGEPAEGEEKEPGSGTEDPSDGETEDPNGDGTENPNDDGTENPDGDETEVPGDDEPGTDDEEESLTEGVKPVPIALNDGNIYIDEIVVGNFRYTGVNIDEATKVFNGTGSGNNGPGNRYTLFVSDEISIYAKLDGADPGASYTFRLTESSDEVLDVSAEPKVKDGKLTASYLGLTQGDCEIELVETASDTTVKTFYINVRNPILVKTSVGEYRKDTVHEYLDILGRSDDFIEPPGGGYPLYVKNTVNRPYIMIPGDTIDLVAYASAGSEKKFASEFSGVTLEGQANVSAYGNGFKKIEQTFKVEAGATGKGKITFGETAFWIEILSLPNSENYANHFDIEVSDGGSYIETEYRYHADGSFEKVVSSYSTFVSGVNECNIYQAGSDTPVATLVGAQYQDNGQTGAQIEFTSAFYQSYDGGKWGVRKMDNVSPELVDSVIFDVKLSMYLAAQTTAKFNAQGVQEGNSNTVTYEVDMNKPADKTDDSVKLVMTARQILDAINKCPDHSGYDFVTNGIAEIRDSLPGNLEITKHVNGNETAKAKTFPFTVELSGTYYQNGSTLSAAAISGNYATERTLNGQKTDGSITFTGGKASFDLTDGETLLIKGLPSGVQYTVKETNSTGFEVTDDDGTDVKASGVVGFIPTLVPGDPDFNEDTSKGIFNNSQPDMEIVKRQAVKSTATKDNDTSGWASATDTLLTVFGNDTVTYYLQVTSTGKATARNVVVTDVMPLDSSGKTADGYLPYVNGSASDKGSYDKAKHTITWNLGDMKPGDVKVVSFQVKVPAVDQETFWKNMGAVAFDGPDNVRTDKPSNEVEIREEPSPSVEIVKRQAVKSGNTKNNDSSGWNSAKDTQLTVKGDDTVTYYLQITSTGAVTAENVTVTDVIPKDSSGKNADGYLTYVSGSASDGGTYNAATHTITWNLGSMEPKAVRVVSFQVKVPTVDKEISWKNIAAAAYDDPNQPSGRREKPSNEVVIAENTVPKTGDPADIGLWTVLLAASGTAGCGLALFLHRKRRQAR